MPKPSFMQSVLRKPTRSYADPYAISPWSDNYDEPIPEVYTRPSRYEPVIDRGAHLGYRERERDVGRRRDVSEDAGPSRPKPRRTATTISNLPPPRPSSSMSTRFPKPARKVTSTVELRETVIVHRRQPDVERVARGDGIKKKKPKAKRIPEDNYSEASSSTGMPFTSAADLRRMKNTSVNDDNSSLASDPSAAGLPQAYRPYTRASESSSSRSSPAPPVTPAIIPYMSNGEGPQHTTRKRRPSASVIQTNVISSNVAPLTPPESDASFGTLNSSDRAHVRPTRTSPLRPDDEPAQFPPPRVININTANTGVDRSVLSSPQVTSPPRSSRLSPRYDSESEDEKFYTPRQSMNSIAPKLEIPEEEEEDGGKVKRPAAEPVDESVETIPAPRVMAPVLALQPPTPAAIEDFENSPLQEADSPTVKGHASGISLAPAIDSPSLDEDERHSIYPEVGSDSEGEGEASPQPPSRPPSQAGHLRQFSKSQPHSRASSFSLAPRPSSRTGSMVILSSQRTTSPDERRSSTLPPKAKTSISPSVDGGLSARSSQRTSPRSMGDFKVFRRNSAAVSESSFGGRSEGAPASGYGKGGWAAAHASSSRSNVASPVRMLMPSGLNHGWADHQVPVRTSKFTPLPPASQAATFENLRLGEELLAVQQQREEEESSSASEYSKVSSGEPMALPSRSYAKQSQSSYSYDSEDTRDMPPPPLPSRGPRGQHTDSPESMIDPYAVTRDRSDTIRAESPRHSRPPRLQDSRPPSAMERYSRSSSSNNNPTDPRRSESRLSYQTRTTPPSGLSRSTSPYPTIPTSPVWSRPESVMSSTTTTRGFDAPSFLNPDTLTLLPEMTVEDSTRTYIPDPEGDAQRKAEAIRRTRSSIYAKSMKSAKSVKSARSDDEGDHDEEARAPSRRSKSVMSHRKPDLSRWETSTAAGEAVLMESNGLDQPHTGGYTTLILPTGAYRPSDPSKSTPSEVNARVLGLPHATMAALVLSSSTHRARSDTPAHLRHQLPAPVDFSSHLKPPTKVNDSQVLVQVYAVAIDGFDLAALDVKGRADVGKWVPGRSFVGRCLQVGSYEKELVRGDLVMGIMDIRKVSPSPRSLHRSIPVAGDPVSDFLCRVAPWPSL